MQLQTHGTRKYPTSALLMSSAGLGWSTMGAELRSHGVAETPMVIPQHLELTLAVIGNAGGLVRRTGAGQCQVARPTTGTIWMTPVHVTDNEVAIGAPLPKMLHLYMPATLFGRLRDDFDLPGDVAGSVRYAAGVRDEVINQAGLSILAAMSRETAGGRMFVETAALMLAARLVHKYCDSGSCRRVAPAPRRLDHARLRRALDYIAAHLADEITLADLARVAALSPFHFARTFTLAIGVPPSRYVSRLRLQKAMAELAAGKLSLAAIALNARFASQASFTRAFRRATGATPGAYRRQRN
jgi:AraC family transcriptional regulator